MKISALLLLLLLLPLVPADSNLPRTVVKGCKDKWLEFTCKYTKNGIQSVEVKMPNDKTPISMGSDVWKDHDRLQLFHNTTNQSVRLLIRKLQIEDCGNYTFSFKEDSSDDKEKKVVEVKQEFVACHEAFAQTAYSGVETAVTCDHPGNKLSDTVYLCKVNNNSGECEESSRTSAGRRNMAGLAVAMAQVSQADQGVYWCTVGNDKYRAAFKEIKLSVEDVFTHSATVTAGETFVYSSNYSTSSSSSTYSQSSAQRIKFLCKGEVPTMCSQLWDGKPVVSDDQRLSTVTVTLQAVTPAHTGTYWCGARSVQGRRSNRIFFKLLLHVVSSANPPLTVTIPAASSSCPSASEFRLVVAVVAACAALLLSVLTLISVYVCCQRSKWRAREEQQLWRRSQGETAYTEVEMEHHHHEAAPGTASKTIYTTAGAADSHDDHVEENGGDAYSSVREPEQAPTYSTVGHPAGPPAAAAAAQDPDSNSTPLYHTVGQH